MDQRAQDAEILHGKLDNLQKKALWLLAKNLGHSELQSILWDFLTARGEIGIDNETTKDIIDFWYNR